MKTTRRFGLCIMAGWMVLHGVTALGYATNRTWVVVATAPDKNWSQVTNWSQNMPPTVNDQATFPKATDGGRQSVFVDADQSISDLRVASVDWIGLWTFSNTVATLTVTNAANFDRGAQTGQNYFYPRLVLGGKLTLTDPAAQSQSQTWNFPNASNQFNGGIAVSFNTLAITNFGNRFGGDLKVGGAISLTGYAAHAGTLQITGTGNVFNAGSLTLNRGGVLTISQDSDFSSITNLLFNGGTLELGAPNTIRTNVFPAYAGGFAVQRGTLLIGAEANLGVGNAMTLGSAGYYGVLKGGPQNVSRSRVERPIALAGNGGVFDVYPSTYLPNNYIASVIQGSGELIKRGPYTLYLANGTDTVFTASSYGGGTRVVEEQTMVDGFRSLGTGNVVVDLSASLRLSTNANVAAGATIHVGRSGRGGTMTPAFLRLYGAGANAAYTLTTNSSGVLALDLTTGAAINSWLAGSAPGNGYMLLGSVDANGIYSGTSLAAGAGNVYRLAGGMNSTWLDLNSGTGNGPLIGNNSLEVGLPYYPYTLWNKGGFVGLREANTYSGTTTVHYLSTLYAYTQSPANASPLGDTNGPVVLNGGIMTIEGWSNPTGQPIKKGDLTFHGSSRVGVRGQTGAVADFTVNALNRVNRSVLQIWGELGVGLGTYQKFKVTTAPVPVNGMVAPYFVGYNGNRFLTYDAAVGFSNAVFTATNIASAVATSVVDVALTEGVPGTGKEIYALRASAAITGTATLTNGSGGMILTGTPTHTAPMAFGGEAVIYVPAGGGPVLSGNLSGAGGLTKAGAGTLYLFGTNAGLSGPITVNEGILKINTTNALGPAVNDVVLNGGTLEDNNAVCNVANVIRLGPLGGKLSSINNNLRLLGGITDLIPGQGGPLRISGGAARLFGTNTHSGGTAIEGINSSVRFDDPNNPNLLLGTGPVRLRNNTSLSIFTALTITNNNARWTLETSQTSILLNNAVPGTFIGSLEGLGTVQLGNVSMGGYFSALTLGGDNTDSDFYGYITEAPHISGHLIKRGAGTFTMWGDNLYSGMTIVTNTGALVINGSLDFSTNVTVYAGATLKGKGAIAAPVTLRGGRLEGSLSVGGLVLTNASTFTANMNGPTPRSQYDQVQVQTNGMISLSADTTLVLNLGSAPTQTFTILNNTSTNQIGGQFSCGQKISGTYDGKTYWFTVNYQGGDGNDVVLSVLPLGTVFTVR